MHQEVSWPNELDYSLKQIESLDRPHIVPWLSDRRAGVTDATVHLTLVWDRIDVSLILAIGRLMGPHATSLHYPRERLSRPCSTPDGNVRGRFTPESKLWTVSPYADGSGARIQSRSIPRIPLALDCCRRPSTRLRASDRRAASAKPHNSPGSSYLRRDAPISRTIPDF